MGYISEDYCSEELSGMLMEKGYIGATNTYLGKDYINVKQITLQSAMKWLREKHYKSIEVRSQGLKATSIGWIVEIFNLVNQDEEFHHPYTFSTYEEACESAIKYCLENLVP